MANYDLGTAHGKVEINYDTGPMKRTKQDLDEVKSKGTSTGQAFDKTARGMGRSGLVIAAGFGLALKATADFEKSISGIGAVTGATGTQLDQVRSKALQLGRDTSFSASQAADAMGELAKAGISLPDIMNGAADATVALAAAGGVALPEAATLAANAMNQFNLSAKDMPKVADLIAGAANASAIDVSDFGQALSQVGAVAHSMGLSLGDTSTAIAVLGNAGIKGSDAGTSLKQMLISLANPTKKSADLMKELGFNAFDAQGHLKPLDAIAQGLQGSMKNLTPQARNAALSIIFGSDAARAGAVFFQNGAAGVDKMSAAMLKVKAADVAKKRMDNLSGSVEQLKGSVETAAIKFGELGQGPLRGVIDTVTKLINKFSDLSGNTQQTIVIVVGSIVGLLLFGAATVKVANMIRDLIAVLRILKITAAAGSAFSALQGGISGVGASLGALAANPIVLIIAAIIALGIALVIAYKKSQTFRNIVNGVFSSIAAVIVGAFHIIAPIVTGTMRVIGAIISGTARAAAAVWNATWPVMATIFRIAWAIIKPIVTVAMAIIRGAIAAGMASIRAGWAVWTFFAPILRAVWNLIIAIVKLAIAIVKLAIIVQLVIIKAIWTVFWTGLKATVQTAMAIIKGIIATSMAILRGIWHAGLAAVRAVVDLILKAIHALFNTWIGQKIVGVARSGIHQVVRLFNALSSIAGSVARIFVRVVEAASKPIVKWIKWLSGIGSAVIGAFKNAGHWLLQAGKNIIIGLINGITSMINKLRGYLGNITNWISQWKGPPSKDKILLVSNGADIMDGLIHGIRKKVPELEAMLRDIGPGNIATSVVQSGQIEQNVSTAFASQAATSAASAVPQDGASTTTAVLDHNALVRAMRSAGVGETTIELDGDVVSKKTERISGRRTSQRRRTG
jgi:TP901 family phage tail tape measure protein